MRSRATRDYFANATPRRLQGEGGPNRRRGGRVRPELLDCNLGSIHDLSPGGIRVRTRRRLGGTRRVILRREGDGGLMLYASVRWSRRIGFLEHEVGLAFARYDDVDRRVLREYALGS